MASTTGTRGRCNHLDRRDTLAAGVGRTGGGVGDRCAWRAWRTLLATGRYRGPRPGVDCGSSHCCLGSTHATAQPLQQRVAGLFDPAGRQYIWSGSWQLFLERPMLGHGPDTLKLVYGKVRIPASWRYEPHATPTKAHNQILNILVSQGLLGFAALVLIVIGMVGVGGGRHRCGKTTHHCCSL